MKLAELGEFGFVEMIRAGAQGTDPAVLVGIGEGNVLEVMKTGVSGVCVVSAICAAANVRRATEALRSAVSGAKQ